MKRILTLAILFAVTLAAPIALHAQTTTKMVIAQSRIDVQAHGNAAHLGAVVAGQFTAALASIPAGATAATASVTAAQTASATALTTFSASSDPWVIVSYSWTILTYADGTFALQASPGGSIGVVQDKSITP